MTAIPSTTLVAISKEPINPALDSALKDFSSKQGMEITNSHPKESSSHYFSERWSVPFLHEIHRTVLRNIAAEHGSDLAFLSPLFDPASIRVLAMDMDSTLINIECIDEIADFAGKKADVAKITEATMRGEIKDFKESLRKRVALLEGISVDVLTSVYQERLRPNPGATELLAAAHQRGLHTLLVSGGFTFFTDQLREQLGFTQTQSNTLEIVNSKLTGKVLGNIVDAAAKASYLEQACASLGVSKVQSIAMGDGANDLLMMDGAGLSVAYQAKPLVKEKADAAFDRVGLDAALLLLSWV
ncbi:phosphoserine phosphatase SerB [Polynucleobacter paludilacus]|uniref:phosphoserine phosphatase SerB n=1 Tax=Polynucleobacter paludilacus TaxID=1855895 RepID=UPI00210A2604|nr:phosphoserine phosphatase SerB [Polynucleobacter paludilacus]